MKITQMCALNEYDSIFTEDDDEGKRVRMWPEIETATEIIALMDDRDPTKLKPLLDGFKQVVAHRGPTSKHASP